MLETVTYIEKNHRFATKRTERGYIMMKKIIGLLCVLVCVFFVTVGAEGEVVLSCSSAILVEATTGQVLYENQADSPMPPASITKIMTMLLTMEAIERGDITYDDIVTASERAKSMGGSTIFLDAGEQMSVRDLLKGVAVASANDACVALGEYIAGSESAFVEAMNSRAKELGMENTTFYNTNGLDAEGHLSTARDIAKMSCALLAHSDIYDFTTIWMDTLRSGAFQLANTNKLIRFYDGATGLKTGSTDGAGCCISASAKRGNLHLVAVVLNAPNSKARFADAKALLDYGFNTFDAYQGSAEGTVLCEIPVKKGMFPLVEGVIESGFSFIDTKTGLSGIEEITLPLEEIVAPVREGDVVGRVSYRMNGTEIGSVRIIANRTIEKRGWKAQFMRILRCICGEM